MSSIDELRDKISSALNFHQGDGKISIPVWRLINDLKDFGVPDIDKYVPEGSNVREFLETMGCRFADGSTIFTGCADSKNNPAVQRHMKLMRDTPGSKPPPHPSYRKPTGSRNFSNWSKVEPSAPMVCRGDSSAVLKESLFYPYRPSEGSKMAQPVLHYVDLPQAPGVPPGVRPKLELSPTKGVRQTRLMGVGNLTYDSVTRFVAWTGIYEQPRKFAPNTFGAKLHEKPFVFPKQVFRDDSDDDYFVPWSDGNTQNPRIPATEEPTGDDPHLLHPKRTPTAPAKAEDAPAPPVPPRRRFTSPLRADEMPTIIREGETSKSSETKPSNLLPAGRNFQSPIPMEAPHPTSAPENRPVLPPMPLAPRYDLKSPTTTQNLFPEGRNLKSPEATKTQSFNLFPEGRNLKSPEASSARVNLFPEGRNLKSPEPTSSQRSNLFPEGRNLKDPVSMEAPHQTSAEDCHLLPPMPLAPRCNLFPEGRNLKSPEATSSTRFNLFPEGRNLKSPETTARVNLFPEGRNLKSPQPTARVNLFPEGNNLKSPLPPTSPTAASPGFSASYAPLFPTGNDLRAPGYTSDGGNSYSRVQSPTSNGVRRRFTSDKMEEPPAVAERADSNDAINPFPDFSQYNDHFQSYVDAAPAVVATAATSSATVAKKEIEYMELAVQHPPLTTHQISFTAANLLSSLQFDPNVDQMTKDLAENLFGDVKPGFALWRAYNFVSRQNAPTLVACERFLCSDSDRCVNVLAEITLAQYNALATPKRFLLGRRYFAHVESRGVVRVVYSCAVKDSDAAGLFFFADLPYAKVQPFNFNRLREIPHENVFLVPNIIEWFEPDDIRFKEKDIVTIFPTRKPTILYERKIYPCKVYKTNMPTTA
uniref:Tudor domain-containing protein n=1 Tax=Panagrellus redivivus TaxID=6233 RepID=A0A7E4ZQ60_PANRE